MTELWETIIRYVLVGAASYAAGTIVQYRQFRLRHVSLLVPFVPKSSRNFTIVVITLSLLTTFSVITSQVQQQHQSQCNADFQQTIRENARINDEDRELERADDDLRGRRDDALDSLVVGLRVAAETGSAVQLLTEYENKVEQLEAERSNLDARRDELRQQRRDNPYPAPRCD